MRAAPARKPGVFKWGARKGGQPVAATPPDAAPEAVAHSKVLPKFIALLAQRSRPVVLDLGPVVGTNVAFFGDQLSCKLYVEDLYADVEAHARRRRQQPEAEPPPLASRLEQAPESVDGILCWDLFDYLDRETSRALAARLTQLLRPGGVLYGLFGTTPVELTHYTRFVLDEDDAVRHRTSPATPVRRNVLTTRDINRMFDGLEVAESVLLKTRTRETLFRKP